MGGTTATDSSGPLDIPQVLDEEALLRMSGQLVLAAPEMQSLAHQFGGEDGSKMEMLNQNADELAESMEQMCVVMQTAYSKLAAMLTYVEQHGAFPAHAEQMLNQMSNIEVEGR